MAKITKLTAEQESRLVSFRAEWRAIGTRTGHDDACVELGRAAVLDAHREIGAAPPSLVLWAQSPMQALLMRWALGVVLSKSSAPKGGAPSSTLSDQLRGQLWGQLSDQLRGQLRDQLSDQLSGQLWGQLSDQLRDQLSDQLRDQLSGQLWGQLSDQLSGQLWGQLSGQLSGQLWEAWNARWCWGQCEAYWTAWARFAISIGVRVTDEQERRLQLMERLARAAYLVFSWQGITILVEHPTIAAFDDRGRLHRTDGPALAWRDGYALYAVRGVRMSPETGAAMVAGKLTSRQILDERNAEVRRVLVAIYNAGDSGRWVRDLGAAPIHSDVDAMGRPRKLYRIEQDGDEPYVLIEVTNSTPELEGELAGHAKQYRFRVHPELRPHADRGARHREPKPQELTCQNAIASSYGFYGHEYQPALET